MKFNVALFILLFFLVSQGSFAQETVSAINNSWANLKTQLQRRTDIVNNLTSMLSKSSKVDKEQLKNSRTFATALFKYVDTLSLKDSASISSAFDKNSKLTQALARTLATVEEDEKFMGNNEVGALFMQLEGCENGIFLAMREYNDTCKKFKRNDLLFGPDKTEDAPGMKF